MASVLRQRRDTAANWSVKNPIIPDGQLCFDITNNTFRIGDGVTNYSNLLIQSHIAIDGADGADGVDGVDGEMIGSNNLSELTNTVTGRSNLGVVIGTDVQAFDADLTTIATNGIGTSANQLVQLNASAELPVVSGANLTNLPPSGGIVSFLKLS